MAILRGTSYNDKPVRDAVKEFYKRHFDILLEETPHELKIIDLTGVTDTELGVEVEGGKWTGNFWTNDAYSLISGQEFRTINIPIRKEKYWLEEYVRYGKTRYNPSYLKNTFVRSNKDFTQFIVIRSETIRDQNKLIRTRFQPNNSNELEDWLSFKKEDVETYNLINGTWVLE